jgi:hypothetical protein
VIPSVRGAITRVTRVRQGNSRIPDPAGSLARRPAAV